ncbi:carbamate kinase [Halosquirtibacter laminarini]|uniref:Carbamate kinase n=1 Tax=Halosquirtibacter laminarini TaxID=3374600 RepID=A0AC61NMR5_9BACT|nr:carbamate kinase [Prolixibacteraceae bacterium]
MTKLAVIALGGNALLRSNQEGNMDQQNKNTMDTLENIVFLLKQNYNLIITHGNGPQVGNILLRNEAGTKEYGIPSMPLDVCVADSQGGIGYTIERNLRNMLKKYHIQREVITMSSMVEVDPDDPAFTNWTKRVGPTYNQEQKDDLESKNGWQFKSSSKKEGSYRRVVPSPTPISVMNSDWIKELCDRGVIVIASGGGGIPVYYDQINNLVPVEGVIDKDMASSVLAASVHADEFYILTDVPYLYSSYGTENQKVLEFLDYNDAVEYGHQGAFGEGTMQPKVNACLDFVKNGGEKAIITEATKLQDKSYGTKITLHYEEANQA